MHATNEPVSEREPLPGAAEGAFAVLGSVPLMLIALEVVIGALLFFVALGFFLTVYLALVGLVLLYLGLWLAVALNTFGGGVALLTLVVGRRSVCGKSLGMVGLLINAALLALAAYALLSIHGVI
jgi:hypothetical protein